MNPEAKKPGEEYADWKAPETGQAGQELTPENQAVRQENRLMRLKSKDFFKDFAAFEDGEDHPQSADKYREMANTVDDLLSGKEDYDYQKTAEAVSVVCANMIDWEAHQRTIEARGTAGAERYTAKVRYGQAREIFMAACQKIYPDVRPDMTNLGGRLDLIYSHLKKVSEPSVQDLLTTGDRPSGPEANQLKNNDPLGLEAQLADLTHRLNLRLDKEDVNRPVDGTVSSYGIDSGIAVKELYKLELIKDQLKAAQEDKSKPQKQQTEAAQPDTRTEATGSRQDKRSAESKPEQKQQVEIPFEKARNNLVFLVQKFNEDLHVDWDRSRVDFNNEEQVRKLYVGLQEIWKAYNADNRRRDQKGSEFKERIATFYASQGMLNR